jgi:hypothetical protein
MMHHIDRPKIQRIGAHSRLVVGGAPMLLRAGELENSASTGRRFMRDVWPRLRDAHVNTVLAALPWDLVEPEEGQFDFRLVDELIEDARAHGMKLVPLWFGTWKNGLSHYVPAWVKRDTARFPRSRIAGGNVEVISAFSVEARDADAKAFAAVMAHIAKVDAAHHTVIMVQVENEVGLWGALRDHGGLANSAYNSPVDAELIDYLVAKREQLLPETRAMLAVPSARQSGTWPQVFPGADHADEAFMAWHYARFIGHVAAAGKAEYDIPMFVNAALDSPVASQSGYFRGGPVAHMADIWRAGAPAIDFIGPDIYHLDYNGFLTAFNRGGNPLFVPESRSNEEGACNALYTVGKGGMGYSPFGIEARTDFENSPLVPTYGVLRDLELLILKHQAEGSIEGLRVSPTQPDDAVAFGGYTWRMERLKHWRTPDAVRHDFGGCLVMQTGPDDFILAGLGGQLRFEVTGAQDRIVGIAALDELVFVDGEWVTDRRISGDEIMQSYDVVALMADNQNGTQVKFWKGPVVYRLSLYSYEK